MAQKKIPKSITQEVLRYLRNLQTDGFVVDKAVLFGSYTQGKQNKWSDIDLCIVSKDLNKKRYSNDYLWKKKADVTPTRIEPVGFTPQDFVDEDPLVWEIKRTGIKVL